MADARARFVACVGAVVAALTMLPAAPPLLVLAGATAGAGCAGDDCDSDTATWGSCSEGRRLDVNTWESGAITGEPWLNDHGERTWVLDPTPWMGNSRVPDAVQVYLSFNPLPSSDGGDGFAQAAGNLGEITLLGSGKVQVLNDSCAQYYLRVVVTYAAVAGGVHEAGPCVTGNAGK